MNRLKDLKCVPCRGDSPLLSDAEIEAFHSEVAGWRIVLIGDVPRLERSFQFINFAEALKFTNQVGEIAEIEDHHPAILTEWGRVTVSWWTHIIKGLHRNDFIMAAKTDALYAA